MPSVQQTPQHSRSSSQPEVSHDGSGVNVIQPTSRPSGAVSTRLRRRARNMAIEQQEQQHQKLQQQQQQVHLKKSSNLLAFTTAHSKLNGFEFEENWTLKMAAERGRQRQRQLQQRRRNFSDDWDADSDEEDDEMNDTGFRREVIMRKSVTGLRNHSSKLLKCSPMETLDRRISVSTEQLDTLRRTRRSTRLRDSTLPEEDYRQHPVTPKSRTRSDSRPKFDLELDPNVDDQLLMSVSFADESANEMHMRNSCSDLNNNSTSSRGRVYESNSSKGVRSRSRSRWNLKSIKTGGGRSGHNLLDSDGPYSRRLYGPPPPEVVSAPTAVIDEERRRRRTQQQHDGSMLYPDGNSRAIARSFEQLRSNDNEDSDTDFISPCHPVDPIKKGLLWQQKDKLFSRWKERYFVLTRDYLHCFKKSATSRMSEMGGFIFKLKLIDVDSVDLLDKRGYLTICLSLVKEGKIYLRRPEGIKDWFTALQHNVYDCKRKRKLLDRTRLDSSSLEQWLLSRQKAGGAGVAQPTASRSSGEINNNAAGLTSHNNATIRYPRSAVSTPNINDKSLVSHDQPPQHQQQQQPQQSYKRVQPPRLSRSQILEKTASASELHESLNSDRDAREDVQSPEAAEASAPKAAVERGHVEPPRGIKRTTLVNELILKERLASSSPDVAISSSSEVSPRSSTSSKGNNVSTGSNLVVYVKSNQAGSDAKMPGKVVVMTHHHERKKAIDDSGNDSGNNSMNTDSQSEGNHSCSEDSRKQQKILNNSSCNESSAKDSVYSSRSRSLSIGEVMRDSSDDNVLSSDIPVLTAAEIKASKTNFNRFKDKSGATSSLRKPLYRKPYVLSQVATDV